uniref:Protease PrsW n=1 Tax=candidate division WOR-3 bacterium TaxID=2052148 RepID=A0A7C6EHH9_UNCW3
MFFILLLIALAPCLFLFWYFIHRDRYEPEPKRYIIKIYFLGALMVLPGLMIEGLLGPIFISKSPALNAFLLAFILVAPTEEILKFLVVKFSIYKNVEFDEVMDGIVYCVASSLGFATIENIFYVFEYGVGTGILRAFLSVPGHALFGALMGYYIGRAKFDKPNEKRLITLGLLFAILTHGIFDFLLFTKTFLGLLVIVVVITLGFLTRSNLKKAEIQSKSRLDNDSFTS